MDKGLDENSQRNIPLGGISGGQGARYERNSAIFTSPGYRIAFDTGSGAPIEGMKEATIYPALWVKSGTKLVFARDGLTPYGIGLTMTTGAWTTFVEQSNGDIIILNQYDAGTRVCTSVLSAAAASGDHLLSLDTVSTQKFTANGTVYVAGNAITTQCNFTTNYAVDTATLTSANHGLANNTIVTLSTSGALPTGLTTNTPYYVINAATNTFQVSLTSGGPYAVTFSSDGSGTQTYNAADKYLHGISGIPGGGLPAGALVTQTSQPASLAGIHGNVASNFDGRLFVGNLLNGGSVILWSAGDVGSNAIINPYFYDFSSFPSGTTSSIPKPLTALISGSGRQYYFTIRDVYWSAGLDPTLGYTPITYPITNKFGAYNQKCVTDMDGTVCFLGNRRLMPITLQLGPIQGGAQSAFPQLDDGFDWPIRPWLATLDPDDQQDGAFIAYNYIQRIMKIGAYVNGQLETRLYDAQSKNFLPADPRPMSAFVMFRGKPYCGDRSNGLVYQDDIGTTHNGVPIFHSWATGRIEYQKGRMLMFLKKLKFDGFMSSDCEFDVNIYLNGSTTPSGTWHFTNSIIASTLGVAIGSNGVGSSLIGGATNGPLAYVYKGNILLTGLSCEDFKLEWVISKAGSFFQLNQFGVDAYLTRMSERSFI